MGIFSRLFKVGEAKANRLLDKLEKPQEMLEQAIRDREKSIKEARARVQGVIATERQNKALLDREQSTAQEWEARAKSALEAGKEELAEKALVRAEEHTAKARHLEPTWQLQRKSIENLKVELSKMQDELSELKRNKDLLIAQAKTAEVRKSIYEAKAAIGKDSTSDLIERMKTKAERASFEASAAEEMAVQLEQGDALEGEFKALSSTTSSDSVKKKLAAMKARLK